MNFQIIIQEPGQAPKSLTMQSGILTVKARASDDVMKVQCIVRPDDWLQVRSNAVSKIGMELTHATIIESDPIRDPNHWLKRSDSQLGKASLVADSQAVRNRRHRVRKGKCYAVRHAR